MNLDEAIAKERERLLLYRSVFNSSDGQKVWQDLQDKFLWQDMGPHVLSKNPMSVAYINGQMMLMRALNKWLTMDVEEYLDRYRKPLELEQGDPLDVGQSQSTGGYW